MENATTTAYAASLVVSALPATLLGLSGHNSSASAQFIQVHDSKTLPANDAVPTLVISVAATTSFGIDFGQISREFASGIVICNSSTGPTKTLGSADCWFDAQYR